MAFNTLKTTGGFLVSLLGKYTPLKFEKAQLEGIYNYVEISEKLHTSGQPTEKQYPLLKAAGFNTVINLAPHKAENALTDEASLAKELGIQYIHIPVDFKNPTDADFERFTAVMQKHDKEKLWVHCAANMRVSAFLFRYRCSVLGEDRDTARQDMDKIWEPFGVWKQFVKLD